MYLLITHITIIKKIIPEDSTPRRGGAENAKEDLRKRRGLRIPFKNFASQREFFRNQSN